MTEASTNVQASAPAAVPRLRRVLTLWDLIFYGIVLIQPTAPIPLFGVVQDRSHGHTVDTILLAMLAMMITAFSYGRMAALYPAAGSAYTYVGRGLNPQLGFLAGWAMFLDYLLQPILNAVWVAVAIHRLLPQVPYAVGALLFVGMVVWLNLIGIRATARANRVLLGFMFLVIGAFIVLAVRHLFHLEGWGGIFSTEPFYNPKTFSFPVIGAATSLAALTYIGFDGVTTLAEDVENPKRNVLLAAVLVCAFTGLFGGLEVYLGQRVWPDYRGFPNLETAFWDVCRRVGGVALFGGMTAVTLLACFGSALTGTLGAARLLFGMGRDNVLPRKFFSYLHPKRNTPSHNIWMIGLLAYVASLFITYDQSAELLNFGAFLAFMGVNLATIQQYYFVGVPGHKRRWFTDLCLPLFGFLFCLWIWWGLRTPAKVVGGIWFAIGLTYAAIKTRGFRTAPVMIDFRES
jgi:amino acid transporter